tara:strand:+ start:323 stop:526 length:204 start_codon:yes stop_codon:yes gene_type:complete
MCVALHSLFVYEEIVAHANLELMTKLTDRFTVGRYSHIYDNEKNEAMLRALISNTEVKILERKTKLD